MKLLVSFLLAGLLAACAHTEFKTYEARNNVFEGQGGTKVVVDGMEIWDNGDPPRKFKVLGVIEDERPGAIIPMAQLKGDMVKKAREAGGDAIVQISSQSRISGYFTTGSAMAAASGNSATAFGNSSTSAARRSTSKYAVVKYLD